MGNGTDLKSPKFFTKLGILIGFITEVISAIFMKMSEAQLQHSIGKKESIRKQLLKMFEVTDVFLEEKEQWRKFYQKHFFLDLNFADVVIPEKPAEGAWRLLIIAQGLTLNQVYDSMSKAFKCWRYKDDLDANVTKNIRDTKIAYAIWVRDGVEPDEKYLGKSTNQADPNMTIGVTLLERMIYEIVYFDETGKHLDVKGLTFCPGSRDSDGGVPCVRWFSGSQGVLVDWYGLGSASAGCGLREAVS
jgi:hypothetical protein